MRFKNSFSVGSNSVGSLKKNIWRTNGTLAGTEVSCSRVSESVLRCPLVSKPRFDVLEPSERTELTTTKRHT